MTDTRAFFDIDAELGSEEEDEDFDETGAAPKKASGENGVDDSSEEEDEDDEDEIRKAGEGFIADEDDEDEGEELSRKEKRRRRKRKNREEDEALDDEDLDLIGIDVAPQETQQSKYKRLKRGHKERPGRSRGVDNIFSDDEEVEEVEDDRRRQGMDEFADFIEEDQFEDEIEDDREVGQPGVSSITKALQVSGLDEGAEEDYRAAFGDGTDYDWALDLQEQADAEEEGEGRELQLKDVFEPSQLADRLLTDEDNIIRETDVPERLQLARKPFKDLDISEEAMEARLNEEALWITKLIWPKKRLDPYFEKPFRKAVRKVLEFLNLEDYEVPFIFNHRKDYLIHAPTDMQNDDDMGAPRDARPERLLNQSELWEVFDLDLKFRAFTEKREALQMHYENLRAIHPDITDPVIEDLVEKAVTIEEVQELQDYLHFRYSQEMNDVRQESATNGQKRANNARNLYDKLRSGRSSQLAIAIGITPDDFAKKAEGTMLGGHFIDDPPAAPEELADNLAEHPENGITLLRSAKLLYTQELQMNPRLRRFMRGSFYQNALIDCIRTEKGMRKITEDHAYYEFKYLRKQTFLDLHGRPELFLKMLKAEEEGLINVRIRMGNYEDFQRKLHNHIVSDNVSEVSELWNSLRKELIDTALDKLHAAIATGVKETLRARCEDELASRARDAYSNKLDQAPYKPRGSELGSVPNVLCLTHGKGQRGDAIMWAYVENDGRVLDSGKLVEFRIGNRDRGIPDGKDIAVFVEVCNRRKPDVLGISGLSVETRRLYKDLQEIITSYDLKGPIYEDQDDGTEKSDPLEVIIVNDEVARLYHNSARAALEFPKYPPLTRYCIALGRYLQNPLAEYASLGRDIITLPFVENQTLIPQEKLLDRLENAMVDMVNLVGINLPDSYDDKYMSKLLPYVCGLGPRKADRLVKAIQANGDEILSRYELMGISEQEQRDLKAAMGPKVFQNCASFLWLPFDSTEETSDYLDNTRVHPEDYELARKMVADAMNMDEEDIQQEVAEGGSSAVIRRMVRDEQTDLIHELVLEDYASEIERKLGNRKRATLETIRAELSEPYEEIRQTFAILSGEEIFTMLTGETKDSLSEGMVVPVTIRRTFPDHIEVRLECGVEGGVSESEFPEGVGSGRQAPRDVFQPHQVVRAKIMYLNRKVLTAQLSLREDLIRQPAPRTFEHTQGDWDEEQERADKKAAEREKEVATGRPNRVVNHPLFFSFNSAQAEEYLGSKEPGDLVIRPSSKGFDHLAVTWKVSDGVFQHIDVLEMNKATEYSVGKQLRIGKQVYSDLDELIVNHVEAMSKKVTELMKEDRFKRTREETEMFLKSYCEANPKGFIYAFCSLPKHPGYFWLCFQPGRDQAPGAWPVKVVPNAFEMQKNIYPDTTALKNGFKMLYSSKGGGAQARPPTAAIPRR